MDQEVDFKNRQAYLISWLDLTGWFVINKLPETKLKLYT